MKRLAVVFILFALYVFYTGFVYTSGTQSKLAFSNEQQQKITAGKRLYQQYNCQACHQIYGLGGYLGPDLTTAISDKHRGKFFVKAILQSGGTRMPNFQFDSTQIDQLTTFLEYVDATAIDSKKQ
jgi:nitric oxide reductase subunit C